MEILHTFMVATSSSTLLPSSISPEQIDERIKQRIRNPLRFYNGHTHKRGSVQPEEYTQSLLNHNRETLTDDVFETKYKTNTLEPTDYAACSYNISRCLKVGANKINKGIRDSVKQTSNFIINDESNAEPMDRLASRTRPGPPPIAALLRRSTRRKTPRPRRGLGTGHSTRSRTLRVQPGVEGLHSDILGNV